MAVPADDGLFRGAVIFDGQDPFQSMPGGLQESPVGFMGILRVSFVNHALPYLQNPGN